MGRELLIFATDLTQSAWYRQHQPPPSPPLPDGYRLQWLDAAADGLDFLCSHDTLQQRLATGAQGLCITHGRRVDYQLWLSAGPQHIEWIGGEIQPPPPYWLAFDANTRPSASGLRLHEIGASAICRRVVELGAAGIVAGIERHELASFGRLYGRLGLGLIRPLYRLIRQADDLPLQREAPDQALLNIYQQLCRRYAAQYPAPETASE